MPSDSHDANPHEQAHAEALGGVGYLLFDSLVHHLIEKGVLTRNDALSVVQTAAEVARSRVDDSIPSLPTDAALTILQRTYSSFEAVQARPASSGRDGHNVHSLRPPLHGGRPRFPSED